MTNQKDNTPLYRYTIGSGDRADSRDEARASAFKNATEFFKMEIVGEIPVEEGSEVALGSPAIDGAEIVPEGQHFCSESGGYRAWVLVRYPQENYRRQIHLLRRGLDLWGASEDLFFRAESVTDLAQRKNLEGDARDSLRAIIADYPVGSQSYFETEHALLRMAELEVLSSNPCAARGYLTQVQNHSGKEKYLRRAARMLRTIECGDEDWDTFLMMSAFSGRTVGLSCCLRVGGNVEAYPTLSAEISKLLTSARAVVEDAGCSQMVDMLLGDGKAGMASEETAPTYDIEVVLLLDGNESTDSGQYSISGHLTSIAKSGGTQMFRDDFPIAAGDERGRYVCLYTLAASTAGAWRRHLLESLGDR